MTSGSATGELADRCGERPAGALTGTPPGNGTSTAPNEPAQMRRHAPFGCRSPVGETDGVDDQAALDAVEAWVTGAQRDGDVAVIAVDGHSAAGKSTFAERAAAHLDASLLHGDDFYRVMDEAEREQLTPVEGCSQYYDWQRLREEALGVLRSGSSATYRPYDWDRNELAVDRDVTIPACRVVVVEGLFVARPELADLVDLAVLVDTPGELRWQRQLERADASEAWLQRWEQAERFFFSEVRPPSTFDIIIDSI